jgi:hypothetical protein
MRNHMSMRRTGAAVAFAATAPEDSRQHNFASAMDDVVQADMVLGLAFARRLEAIDRARLLWNVDAEADSRGSKSEELRRRAFVAEIAAVLRMAERTADRLIETARVLTHDLPATIQALREGRVNQRHAQVLAENIVGLDAASAGQLESRMLPVAEQKTPSQFERSVRRARERLHPETMVERQVAAVEDRGTTLIAGQDGVGVIELRGPIVVLTAIENRISDIARSRSRLTIEETRTLAQLKFDTAADILLDVDGQKVTTAGHGDGPMARFRSIRPTVLVTVPVSTLLNGGSQPGELEGYGPIDAQTAREIASLPRTWRRLFTDATTGIVLRMGREKYSPPDDLRIWLRVRDGTCRFPGCNRSAKGCDLDHTEDWYANSGPSDHDNLAHLCRKHHTLKHHSDWSVEQLPGGILKWISPAGIRYEADPDVRMVG